MSQGPLPSSIAGTKALRTLRAFKHPSKHTDIAKHTHSSNTTHLHKHSTCILHRCILFCHFFSHQSFRSATRSGPETVLLPSRARRRHSSCVGLDLLPALTPVSARLLQNPFAYLCLTAMFCYQLLNAYGTTFSTSASAYCQGLYACEI